MKVAERNALCDFDSAVLRSITRTRLQKQNQKGG